MMVKTNANNEDELVEEDHEHKSKESVSQKMTNVGNLTVAGIKREGGFGLGISHL